jgi:D-amino peptidase
LHGIIMKIYVSCDLEGTAGVVNHELQCRLKGEYYKQTRRLATLELNALAEGALEAGATRIVAWNGHCEFPGGLDYELIHPEVELIMGAGDGGPVHLDESYDALSRSACTRWTTPQAPSPPTACGPSTA